MTRQKHNSAKEVPDPKANDCGEGLASLLEKYNDDPTWEEFRNT
jgi:hypothetical protein